MKVLIAEDEPAMQKILKVYLEKEGYDVTLVGDGQSAIEALYEERFQLVLLDWMMPKLSGIEVCKEIKRLGIAVKILMLTAKSAEDDEVKGLSEGVDDYIKKPFDPRILILRINKLLKKGEVLTCGELRLYPDQGQVMVGDVSIKLSPIEQKLLIYFMQNDGLVLSREKLLNHVWGMTYEGDDRTVDTHIRRLRKKIGEELIQTYRGMGYRLGKAHE